VDPDGWGGTTEIGESSAQLHSSNCLTVLTNEFARSLGLPNGNPDTDVDGKSLAELNDSGVSFKGIADIIERNF
jgi:hypothetical protein